MGLKKNMAVISEKGYSRKKLPMSSETLQHCRFGIVLKRF
jgi:hypothetical protein